MSGSEHQSSISEVPVPSNIPSLGTMGSNSQWSYVWEIGNGETIKYFDNEADYQECQRRIRRSSFGGRFSDKEVELISLLLHINTGDLPNLGEYREIFITEYFHMKRSLEKQQNEGKVMKIEFDDWNRHMVAHELKIDLQRLVLEGRPGNRDNHTLIHNFQLGMEVRNLLIAFCEEHERAILCALMESHWPKVLRHTPGYEHLGEDLTSNFKSWIQAPGKYEVDYIHKHIRLQSDNDIARFMQDLSFLLVEIYLKLHDGHELYCGEECDYREEMGSKLRALYVYGCLGSEEFHKDGESNTQLKQLLEQHITEVVPPSTAKGY